jgi:hypothetical protein
MILKAAAPQGPALPRPPAADPFPPPPLPRPSPFRRSYSGLPADLSWLQQELEQLDSPAAPHQSLAALLGPSLQLGRLSRRQVLEAAERLGGPVAQAAARLAETAEFHWQLAAAEGGRGTGGSPAGASGRHCFRWRGQLTGERAALAGARSPGRGAQPWPPPCPWPWAATRHPPPAACPDPQAAAATARGSGMASHRRRKRPQHHFARRARGPSSPTHRPADYFMAEPEGGASAGAPAILLVHGFGAFGDQWRFNLAPLAAAGYRVFAPTLPGFGRSEKAPVAYSQDSWRDFLRWARVLCVGGWGWGWGWGWGGVRMGNASPPRRASCPTAGGGGGEVALLDWC